MQNISMNHFNKKISVGMIWIVLTVVGLAACSSTPVSEPTVELVSLPTISLPTVFPTETPTLPPTLTLIPSITPIPTRTPLPSPTSSPLPSSTSPPTIAPNCPGALPGKLKIGDRARVNYYQVSARSAPGFSSLKEHVLATGRVVEIIAGPRCADSAVWWQIYFAGTVSSGEYLEYEAWMPEVDKDIYYLVRVP